MEKLLVKWAPGPDRCKLSGVMDVQYTERTFGLNNFGRTTPGIDIKWIGCSHYGTPQAWLTSAMTHWIPAQYEASHKPTLI